MKKLRYKQLNSVNNKWVKIAFKNISHKKHTVYIFQVEHPYYGVMGGLVYNGIRILDIAKDKLGWFRFFY